MLLHTLSIQACAGDVKAAAYQVHLLRACKAMVIVPLILLKTANAFELSVC